MQNAIDIKTWVQSLDYRQIRSAESLQPAKVWPSGRRLRGIMLTTELCLGRDRRFYMVRPDNTGRAEAIGPTAVAERFTAADVKQLYVLAVAGVRKARSAR